MDYLAYNRSQLNTNRIRRIDDKVMVFIVPSIVQVGVVRTELRFPYKGKILNAYATCGTKGLNRTVIDIEKCSQGAYDTVPVWTSIFNNVLIIDSNHKSNRTSTKPYSMKPSAIQVNIDDHFRLNILEVGNGVKDITVELVIELLIEED
ncbi:hypothetical protein [Metabacillus fastidiosus]|uniref:hypothetical protein n=1 Tax=Metabacillus fastidiosus TaxID=1458 RepID=UPI003D29A2BA